MAVSVQSSGFCSSEIFSVVVVPAARSIRNLLDSSVRITLCLHSSKYGLCEFLTIQITPSSAAGDVLFCVYLCVCVCVCAFICECVLWEASFVTGILPSLLFRESWVTLFETCCQISGFHFLSFVLFVVVDWHAFCSFECVLYLKSCYVLYVHYVFVMLSFKMFAVECPSDMHVRTHTHTHTHRLWLNFAFNLWRVVYPASMFACFHLPT